MAHLHVSTLFKSSLTSVADVSCGQPASPCGGEELAPAHQLVFVRRGVWMKHSGAGGKRTLVAEPAHVLFLNCDEPYRVSHPVAGGDECTALDFSRETVAHVAGRYDVRCADRVGGPFHITHAPLTPHAAMRLRTLRRGLHAEHADALAIQEVALGVLDSAVRDGFAAVGVRPTTKRTETLRQRRQLVEHTKLVLASAPGAAHSLAQLACDVHSSPFHLTRVFREITGLPVHQYLLRLRLTLALERIEKGEQHLSALALDLGFSSHSHLSSAFRRTFGLTPTAFIRAEELSPEF